MKKTRKNFIFLSVFLLMLLVAQPAYGYIDPATSSYIIQVVAGVVIAFGAAVGIFWKKIRLFFRDTKNSLLEKKLTAQAEAKDKDRR